MASKEQGEAPAPKADPGAEPPAPAPAPALEPATLPAAAAAAAAAGAAAAAAAAAAAPQQTVVVSISDIHGLHLRDDVIDLPEGDVLVVAGDIELRSQRDIDLLAKWLAKQPHTHKVVGFGNMDTGTYAAGKDLRIPGAQVVVDSVVEVGGLRLLASPWSPEYAGVWQLEDEAAGKRHWSTLLPPELEIDVLVTHTPPYGYGDVSRGKHVGDKQLMDAVQALKTPPRLWICGHIHESVGEHRVPHPRAKDPKGILLINAAVYYAGVRGRGFEHKAQPRAVLLPEGRVVAQGDPARLRAPGARGGGGGRGEAGGGGGAGGSDKKRGCDVFNPFGIVWSANKGPIRY